MSITRRQSVFAYNPSDKKRDPPEIDGRGDDPAPSSIVFRFIHDESVPGYTLHPKKISGRCDEGYDMSLYYVGEEGWDVKVVTEGWKLGFSGAYTLSSLTDPVYFLDPAKDENDMDGFIVRRNSSAEDSTNQDLAVMAHLYHNRKFRIGHSQVSWAPISLGIGFNDSTSYYVGTSFRFGTAMYLTLGGVFGDTPFLPANVSQGDFTMDANSLTTLGERSDTGIFLGFSYKFGDVDLGDKFGSAFKSPIPAPTHDFELED